MPGMGQKGCTGKPCSRRCYLLSGILLACANNIFRFKADHFHFQSFVLFHVCVLLSALVCTFSLPFTIIGTICKDVNTFAVLYMYTGYIQYTIKTPCNHLLDLSFQNIYYILLLIQS